MLITYDVNTTTKQGRSRLAKIAKQCVNYGVRVQNSVFECVIEPAKFVMLKHKLLKIIDEETDSLRFYYLGDKYKTKIEHFGAKTALKVDEPIIF